MIPLDVLERLESGETAYHLGDEVWAVLEPGGCGHPWEECDSGYCAVCGQLMMDFRVRGNVLAPHLLIEYYRPAVM